MFAPRHLRRQVPGSIVPQAAPRNMAAPSRGLFGEKYQAPKANWADKLGVVGGMLTDLSQGGGTANTQAAADQWRSYVEQQQAKFEEERLKKIRQAAALGDPRALAFLDPLGNREFMAGREDRAEDVGYRNKVFNAGRSDRADDVAYRNNVFAAGRTDRASDEAWRQGRANAEDAQWQMTYDWATGEDNPANILAQRKVDAGPDREIRNDANGIPRYVDTGEPVYPDVSSQPKPLIGAETMPRVVAGLPGAKRAVETLNSLMTGELGDQKTEWLVNAPGYDPASDWGASMVDAIPDWGALKGFANWIGGQDYQTYNTAYAQFEAALLPILSGAAISESEAKRQLDAVKVRPGDSNEIRDMKLAQMGRMVDGLELAAKGDSEGFMALLNDMGMQTEGGDPDGEALVNKYLGGQ